jgi:hypothetical protein
MSVHIEDYSHLVQQVELRHGIDRKAAAACMVEASSISWIFTPKAPRARRSSKGISLRLWDWLASSRRIA